MSFLKSPAADGDSEDALYGRGFRFYVTGNAAEAAEEFRTLLRINPSHTEGGNEPSAVPQPETLRGSHVVVR